MSPVLDRRAIVKRNVVENWGKSLQSWVQQRPPATVFALAIVMVFLSALVLLSLIWETIRKCRNSYRASAERERARWIQLPDGSSVLTQGRVPDAGEVRRGHFAPGTHLGPMASLLRGGQEVMGQGATSNRQREARYVPTQSGSTREMVADSQTSYAPYDPPVFHSQFERRSTGGTSRWSEQTKVESEAEIEEKGPQRIVDHPKEHPTPAVVSSILVPSIPPPPRPVPSSNSSSNVATIPVSSPLARPIGYGHTRQASSGGFQPKDLHLVNTTGSQGGSPPLVVVGENRFSTPKPTPTPFSASSMTHSVKSSITASTSGWSAPTLANSPTPSEDPMRKSFVSSTSIFPPRVDLKRSGTWSSSLSNWIPGYSGSTSEKDASELGNEEETKKLVDEALKNAR
ncbi:hypothetical protein JCM5350_000779 [Sporobolomyces pararoseus]